LHLKINATKNFNAVAITAVEVNTG